ncbi:cation diffusion facilitator family transporter [Dasania marina]|uniref:cation diffusion facilitator family transporter n=1 Tax=Dasania marina TaxID=471499 RepID=UPI0030D9AAC8|tara:strand:- start:70502 stop:71662 length:1161 start_codon:yes stop_codon:yes gene_type:complete
MDAPAQQRQHEIQKVTLIGAVLDALLGFAKVIVGVLANSHALIADGIHSFSDLLTDAMVIVVSKFSHHGPDEDHPYGHGRFETFATVVLGSLLIAVAGAMAYDSVYRLIYSEQIHVPAWPALVVAGISIVSKEWIYHYTKAVGEKYNSKMVIANAWHSRSDAISSIVVLVGVGGAMLGISWLDNVAALVVAIMIAKIGWDLAWESVQELVDTALSTEEVDGMKDIIMQIEGVVGVHELRSRKMGADALLDIHIQVGSKVSVSEGHNIGVWVTDSLLKNVKSITDVTVHIDPEDDDNDDARIEGKVVLLPLRGDVMAALNETWEGITYTESIKKINLHYLRDSVQAEVFMPADVLNGEAFDRVQFQTELQKGTSHLPWLSHISVWFG